MPGQPPLPPLINSRHAINNTKRVNAKNCLRRFPRIYEITEIISNEKDCSFIIWRSPTKVFMVSTLKSILPFPWNKKSRRGMYGKATSASHASTFPPPLPPPFSAHLTATCEGTNTVITGWLNKKCKRPHLFGSLKNGKWQREAHRSQYWYVTATL